MPSILEPAKPHVPCPSCQTEVTIVTRRFYAKSPDCEFLGNLEAIAAAKYAFIVMIEATVSIATHLCARLLSKAPSSQRESFELLGDSGVLPAALASELAKMAGFRNVLVHGYAEVDNASVLTIMREQLGDLEEFLSVVSTLCRAGG